MEAKRSRVELEKAARKAAAAYAKELKAGKQEADRAQREAMKNQTRLAKALDDQAKALANLRRKQEQVAKANKRSREMELKKAACIAARNTAKGKKNDTKKAAKVIGVTKWAGVTSRLSQLSMPPRRLRITPNDTITTPTSTFTLILSLNDFKRRTLNPDGSRSLRYPLRVSTNG